MSEQVVKKESLLKTNQGVDGRLFWRTVREMSSKKYKHDNSTRKIAKNL